MSGTMSTADQQFDAIDAILSQAKDGKLDKAQTDQLKAHIDQLRQIVKQGGDNK
jgi:hypothetical protein